MIRYDDFIIIQSDMKDDFEKFFYLYRLINLLIDDC